MIGTVHESINQISSRIQIIELFALYKSICFVNIEEIANLLSI